MLGPRVAVVGALGLLCLGARARAQLEGATLPSLILGSWKHQSLKVEGGEEGSLDQVLVMCRTGEITDPSKCGQVRHAAVHCS
jgi:hypothetical protein